MIRQTACMDVTEILRVEQGVTSPVINRTWYETTAKYDWFLSPAANKLHYVRFREDAHWAKLENNACTRGRLKLYCGIQVYWIGIPGIQGRLATPRCRRCCGMFHIPPGIGSPRYDSECRRILGIPEVDDERAALCYLRKGTSSS